MQRGAWLMITSALAFSVMTALVKLAGERLPSQEIVVARALVSLVLSYALLRSAGVSPWGQDRKWLWFRGFLGFAGLSCVYGAVTHLPLAEATVIQFLHPPMAAILARIFLGEAISGRIVAASGLSFLGVLFVARPALLFAGPFASAGRVPLDPLWVGVAIAGAFFSASAYVVVRRLSAREDPLVIVFYFPLVTLPAALPTIAWNFVWPVGLDWLWLMGVGLMTQVGQVSLTRGLTLLSAAKGTALSYLQVVFAALWGLLIFGDRPDPLTIVGGGLVIASSIFVSRDRSR
jgi:drug/metabolite transporter (DMT)-like permease